jgi:hypothetical protein
MQKPRVPEVRGAPDERACPRGMPHNLGFRPRPRARHVPRFYNGATESFDGPETSTAVRAARRAPSPPRSRGDSVLPFPNFSVVCERSAVKTTPLALLAFLLAPESWCPRRPPGSMPNAPALRRDYFFIPAQAGRARWYPGANMRGGGPSAIRVRPVSLPCLCLR